MASTRPDERFDLGRELALQLTWHWGNQVWPHLDGLTDDEYLWEPVPGCWSLRRRDQARTSLVRGAGDLVLEDGWPPPEPAPITTIAWRTVHLIVPVFARRTAAHFGGPPVAWDTFELPATAQAGLAALDGAYQGWVNGLAATSNARLMAPVGPAEPFPEAPLAGLVLHIHREAIHHLAEILLLRDLHRLRDVG